MVLQASWLKSRNHWRKASDSSTSRSAHIKGIPATDDLGPFRIMPGCQFANALPWLDRPDFKRIGKILHFGMLRDNGGAQDGIAGALIKLPLRFRVQPSQLQDFFLTSLHDVINDLHRNILYLRVVMDSRQGGGSLNPHAIRYSLTHCGRQYRVCISYANCRPRQCSFPWQLR